MIDLRITVKFFFKSDILSYQLLEYNWFLWLRMYSDKKENQIFLKFSSYIRKFRMEQLQSDIWLTASSYMGKYLRISSYIMKHFLIYDFATVPLWISLHMKKILFSFLSVYDVQHTMYKLCALLCLECWPPDINLTVDSHVKKKWWVGGRMAPDIKTHPTSGQLKIIQLRLAYLFLRSAVTIRIGRLFVDRIVYLFAGSVVL